MKSCVMISFLLFVTSLNAQSLKDSLFNGKLKMDSTKTAIKPDAGGSATNSERRVNNEVYSMQKPWKKFVEQYTFLISTEVIDLKKVKYGIYNVMIEARIETDSMVIVEKITCDPESNFIVNRFLEAMKEAPKLTPGTKDGLPVQTKFRQPIRVFP